MIEWVLTSSLLILAVLTLRFFSKKHVPAILQYSLWLIVLVRLLLPFSISSPFSVMNLFRTPDPPVFQAAQSPVPAIPNMGELSDAEIFVTEIYPKPSEQVFVTNVYPEPVPQFSLNTMLNGIWLMGFLLCAAAFLVSNLHYALRLRRTGTPIWVPNYPLPIYQTPLVPTPCLFGLFRPAVYLPAADLPETTMRHILAHELTHAKHLDPVWSALRCIVLALHWYNPLVWIAAFLSRQDAELACDEATIRTMGNADRTEYGRILIAMSVTKHSSSALLITATTMTGGKQALKERILRIAKYSKRSFFTSALLCLLTVLSAGCTFTGAQVESTAPETTPEMPVLPLYTIASEPFYMDDGVQACFVNINGTVYVWDYAPNAEITPERIAEHITYLGEVETEDIFTIPTQHLAACRLPVGTKLYSGRDIYGKNVGDVIYCQPCPGIEDPESYGRLVPESRIRGDDRWWEKEESPSSRIITMEEVKDLFETGKLLYQQDFEGYSHTRFGTEGAYRILPVEESYRLFLIFHPNPEVELCYVRLYHKDDPDHCINPLEDDIEKFFAQ